MPLDELKPGPGRPDQVRALAGKLVPGFQESAGNPILQWLTLLSGGSIRRHEPDNAVRAVENDVAETVRTGGDVADAADIFEDDFL